MEAGLTSFRNLLVGDKLKEFAALEKNPAFIALVVAHKVEMAKCEDKIYDSAGGLDSLINKEFLLGMTAGLKFAEVKYREMLELLQKTAKELNDKNNGNA